MRGKNINLVMVGTGGQGLITLLRILSEAALIENKDFKAAETHGLSQRGGSVEVHIRFGKDVFSPLVSQAGADLILALELQESLRALYYTASKTQFLINEYFLQIPGESLIPVNKIFSELKKFTKNIKIVKAAEVCKKELGKDILAGIYLMSLASFRGLIPLKPISILKAIKSKIPEKYLELNLKAFNLASGK